MYIISCRYFKGKPEDSMLRLLILAVMLLSWNLGCANGGDYQAQSQNTPSMFDVPPSFYNYDPTMKQWFSPPYFDPYEMP